ncbi:MAG: hypothetical protein Q9220_004018 [cf. Caloplaca sp. 1 TL-2023]
MNHQDNIRIFVEGVEGARRDKQALSQEVGTAVDLKFTVDVSHKNIYEVPEEVIDILKSDVDVLKLSQNKICYIPALFSQCLPLRYLNLRANLLQDFPDPLFALEKLEILDLSHNTIREVPDNIRQLKALKVLSLTRNKIRDVPVCIKDLNTLKVIKLASNPLRPELARIVEAEYDGNIPDAEKESFVTMDLKQCLQVEAGSKENGDGSRYNLFAKMTASANYCPSSEGPLETPRAPMRSGSFRFHVKSNGSGPEAASEARSPGFAKPPIPARSHYRVTSGQNSMMHKSELRRPGLAPLSLGNERNRSNSESVLQVTQNNARNKRMGMYNKKKVDLGTVDEHQQKRTSFHLRGQSHASALREWNPERDAGNASTNGRLVASQQPPDGLMHTTGVLTPYMSKLQNRSKRGTKTRFLDAAKGVRFSLSTFDQCTSSLIDSLPFQPARRWVHLRDAQHDATFKVNTLSQSVNDFVQRDKHSLATRQSRKKAMMFTLNACQSAVARHIRLGQLLLDQSSQILAEGGKAYARILMSVASASSMEACHALHRLGQPSKRRTITQKWFTSNTVPMSASHHIIREEPLRDQSLTPTRERPVTAKRIKDGDMPQQPNLSNVPRSAPITQPTVPLYFNGRSRSNSRADQYPLPSSTGSTFPGSPAMTPMSSGLFSIPGTPLNRSRSSSVAAGAYGGRVLPPGGITYFENDPSHQVQFDKVHGVLETTVIYTRKSLPVLRQSLMESLNHAQINFNHRACETWSKRVRTCSHALDLSDTLFKKLQAIRYPENVNVRYEKSFWDLCKKFLNAVSDLLIDVRETYKEGYLDDNILDLMRPISKSSKRACHEINDSLWNFTGYNNSTATATTTSPSPSASASSSHTNANGYATAAGSRPTQQQRHTPRLSEDSSTSYSTTSIPATPLSAALGPAAQATVPSTPASGALERSFQGGWGERADALLAQQQTMVHRVNR